MTIYQFGRTIILTVLRLLMHEHAAVICIIIISVCLCWGMSTGPGCLTASLSPPNFAFSECAWDPLKACQELLPV